MKIALLMSVFILAAGIAVNNYSAGGTSDVLVVQNANSAVSKRVAAYYLAKRKIDPKYLVSVRTADSSLSKDNERISPSDYLSKIEIPVVNYLRTKKIANKIRYIVLTKGIPLRLSTDPEDKSWVGQSVDSMLAAVGTNSNMDMSFGERGSPRINRYWGSEKKFSHAEFGGYLVTRLDGYTEADAKALVDRALSPVASEKIVLLDVSPSKGVGDPDSEPAAVMDWAGNPLRSVSVDYKDYNADMIRLGRMLDSHKDLKVITENTADFVAGPGPITFYVSWGSNDYRFTKQIWQSLRFSSRSIAETAVSTSARTMLKEEGGQSLIADLIAQGAAGAKGYVTEPFLPAIASPSISGKMYLSGRNLAESFYAGSRFIRWKDIVLGDPLCSLSDK